jgi:hypothetical protein
MIRAEGGRLCEPLDGRGGYRFGSSVREELRLGARRGGRSGDSGEDACPEVDGRNDLGKSAQAFALGLQSGEQRACVGRLSEEAPKGVSLRGGQFPVHGGGDQF